MRFHIFLAMAMAATGAMARAESPRCISGVYPHLAMYNHGGECGIGAVVPWADRLWVITYPPHQPRGSDDGLYEINADLQRVRRPESIGGTCANRLVHRESQQLFIGPYVIDAQRRVRAIPFERMPGRLTATARHLIDPVGKVYFFTMEEGLYEVDVADLSVRTIHPDGNRRGAADLLPGCHGKGAYTGQGRLVVANNGQGASQKSSSHPPGAAGCLAEWDGRHWTVIANQQFCDVSGPGGLAGNRDDRDPIWAVGWDDRSVLLRIRQDDRWHTFRLPKGSAASDGRHGWYTEWPRIRQIDHGRLLMNMHGLLWQLPPTFSATCLTGLKPLAGYLRMFGDFCYWRGRVVFGCDDAARIGNRLCGQSNSNLWFVQPEQLAHLGRRAGFGGVWLDDAVRADVPSDPFAVGGFDEVAVHLWHQADQPMTFTLECNRDGQPGRWKTLDQVTVPPGGDGWRKYAGAAAGSWLRVRTDCDGRASAWFDLRCAGDQPDHAEAIWSALAQTEKAGAYSVGIVRPRGHDRRTLQFAASVVDEKGRVRSAGYYQIGPQMQLRRVDDPSAEQQLRRTAGLDAKLVKARWEVEPAAVVVTDGRGRRWRLPKTDRAFDKPFAWGRPRFVREVVTERSLVNCHGTIYELPRDSAGGWAAIKPLCTHHRIISDFCSWRGLLVVAGCQQGAKEDGHFIAAKDEPVGLWFGVVDDLWKLGRPRGLVGAWTETPVRAGESSDPCLMFGYARRKVRLAHDATRAVNFTVELDSTGKGPWRPYRRYRVEPGRGEEHRIEAPAHWARLSVDRACRATAVFEYD